VLSRTQEGDEEGEEEEEEGRGRGSIGGDDDGGARGYPAPREEAWVDAFAASTRVNVGASNDDLERRLRGMGMRE
jgi:hypothetical protein